MHGIVKHDKQGPNPFVQTVSIEILVYYSRQSFKFVALSEIMENKGNNLKFSSPKVGLLGTKRL